MEKKTLTLEEAGPQKRKKNREKKKEREAAHPIGMQEWVGLR